MQAVTLAMALALSEPEPFVARAEIETRLKEVRLVRSLLYDKNWVGPRVIDRNYESKTRNVMGATAEENLLERYPRWLLDQLENDLLASIGYWNRRLDERRNR